MSSGASHRLHQYRWRVSRPIRRRLHLPISKVLQKASEAAEKLLREDPKLEKEEHQNLKDYLQYYVKQGLIETTL